MDNIYDIPDDAQPTSCRGCSAKIYFVRTKNGKWMPVNPDGTPHWGTCDKAKQFRKE